MNKDKWFTLEEPLIRIPVELQLIEENHLHLIDDKIRDMAEKINQDDCRVIDVD